MYFETKDLSVGYGRHALIRNINLRLERGQILTLVGPNGAGKSTILKTITRHLERIKGVVLIEQHNIAHWSNKTLAKKLSVMLTERVTPELMTCGQVVAMGRYPYTNHFGMLTPEDRQKVTDALELVHARELELRPFSEISDGQRQRILLARAICQEPAILVLDEPTSYLDIRHKIELLDILRQMATERNVAIVMSLHEIDLAAKISDQIICVKGDQLDVCGTPEEIFTDSFVRSLYDIECGSFNTLFGSVELVAPGGDPDVFVVAGEGKGIAFYRVLQKNKQAFSTGVIFENDVDYQVARALSAHVVSAAAFLSVEPEKVKKARALVDRAKVLVDAGARIGEHNFCNGELLAYATQKHKPIVRTVRELVHWLKSTETVH